MVYLFEDCMYNLDVMKGYLSNSNYYCKVPKNNKGLYKPSCVGYYYNAKKQIPVFILPKVFCLKDEHPADGYNRFKAFGNVPIPYNEPIFSDNIDKLAVSWNKEVLYDIPFLLYNTLAKYRKQMHNDTDIPIEDIHNDIITSKTDKEESTLLDIALSMIDFYRDNQNLFTFIFKKANSGYNKIKWSKTIKKENPIICEQGVIYPHIVNHRKQINYDEELLVIFFSTLEYIHKQYGYPIRVDQPYHLIQVSKIQSMIKNGQMVKKLKSIKNNYFSDKLISLFNVTYAFYSKQSLNNKGKSKEEYLLAKKFNIIFEKVIDDIIGDKIYPDELKNQKDDKIIDHLIRHQSLLKEDNDIYYIGDSKYYTDGGQPSGPAKFKQYTYAKNIIQTEIDWYNRGKTFADGNPLSYRDYDKNSETGTEGYNITPNFFIMGKMEKDYGYKKHNLHKVPIEEGINKGKILDVSYQFKNRLFDRDTLFLMHYCINFVFVLKAYTNYGSLKKKSVKQNVKQIFRKDFLYELNQKYLFKILSLKEGNEPQITLDKYFRRLIGKIYSPFGNLGKIIFSVEKGNDNNINECDNKLLEELNDYYDISDYTIGDTIV